MKYLFKPDDFRNITMNTILSTERMAANVANKKLNAFIESWPVVYNYHSTLDTSWHCAQPEISKHAKLQARLAFIEPIVKEPCKHEPVFSKERVTAIMHNFDDESEFYKAAHCKHCGVELQATWSEKK